MYDDLSRTSNVNSVSVYFVSRDGTQTGDLLYSVTGTVKSDGRRRDKRNIRRRPHLTRSYRPSTSSPSILYFWSDDDDDDDGGGDVL